MWGPRSENHDRYKAPQRSKANLQRKAPWREKRQLVFRCGSHLPGASYPEIPSCSGRGLRVDFGQVYQGSHPKQARRVSPLKGALYGVATHLDALHHFFRARDATTLENEVHGYCRELQSLKTNRTRPPDNMIKDFKERRCSSVKLKSTLHATRRFLRNC